MRICFTSYVIREMKTRKMRDYYTSIKRVKILKLTIPNSDVEQENAHSLMTGMQNGTVTLKKSICWFL